MTPSQTEKQAEHAATQRAITGMVREFGVTRSQARQALHEQASVLRQQRLAQQAQQQQVQPGPPPPPRIDIDTTVFEPKPLTLGDSSGPDKKQKGGGDGSNTGTLLTDVVYLDTVDGLLYYTDVFTDGRKDPV